jgi:hypothetical protein
MSEPQHKIDRLIAKNTTSVFTQSKHFYQPLAVLTAYYWLNGKET